MNAVSASYSNNSNTASYAITASYAMNGGGGGGLSALYIQDEGITQGTASYIDFTGAGVTATVSNGTASINIPGGGGGSGIEGQNAILNQTVAATTWSFTHNLGTQYPVFTIFDSNDNVIIPQQIYAASTSSALIYFSTARAGHAVASLGGGIVSSSYAVSASYALNATSASYALNSDLLDGKNSTEFATTGSNIFTGTQTITGSFNISGSTTQVGNITLSGSINISGSLTASTTLNLSGALRLDPAIDPGSNNATASWLFTSASNTATGFDLYYRQKDNIVKFKWLEGGISSGLLYGGVITFSGSMIYVSSGSGVINNVNASTGSEVSPYFTYVNWNAYSASATYLTSSQNTYLYVDNAGTIHQQTAFFDQTQYEQAIPLGRVTHANYATITGAGSNVQTTYDSDSQQSAFIRAFGPIKVEGFTPSGQSGSLRINIGDGTAFNLGGFYPQDPNSPSHYTATTAFTSSIIRAYRTGSGIYQDNNNGSFYTVVDPTKYDNGNGLSTITGGQYTIQRFFYNPVTKRTVIYYGQNTYNSIATALTNLPSDSFTEGEFTSKSLVFAGYLIVKGNASDLTNPDDAYFLQAGILRNISGGSSGAASIVQTLDDLSDVNISLPSNGQALIYNGGTWINGTPISSSYASGSTSASFATTASYVINAQTASFVLSAISASHADSASNSLFAQTASYVQNAQTASYVQNAQTASYVQTAQTASYILNAVSASYAASASNSLFAQTASYWSGSIINAETASYVQNAQTASYILNAISASHADSASNAVAEVFAQPPPPPPA